MGKYKPLKKLPQKMRKNIAITDDLVTAIGVIERRYLSGAASAAEYYDAMHDVIVAARILLVK